MKIQFVSKYISLSEEGLVDRLECPVDQGPLFSNQNLEDEIFLYCLSCEYTKTVGLKLYDTIVNKVEEIINGK
jgi:hypothetical protein